MCRNEVRVLSIAYVEVAIVGFSASVYLFIYDIFFVLKTHMQSSNATETAEYPRSYGKRLTVSLPNEIKLLFFGYANKKRLVFPLIPPASSMRFSLLEFNYLVRIHHQRFLLLHL